MKLLKVTANNFKLCEDNFTISFVPIANKTMDDKEFELSEIDNNLFVFNTIGIVGKNASGKTTVTDLLSIVYDILNNFRIKSSSDIFNYIDNDFNLEITFYHEKFLYHYITTLSKKEVISTIPTIIFKNQKLFKKEYKKTYVNDIFNLEKYEEIKINNNLPEDTSIIYLYLNKMILRGICCPCDDIIYHDFSTIYDLYNSFNNVNIIKSIIKLFDEHITNIERIENNKYKVLYSNNKTKEVNDKDLYHILSSGTSKGFGLFTLVVFALQTGCDLVLDEIENHFHKTLVENLINLFKDKSVNKKHSTLIFTTHYCELLDLFNRDDNIYITKYEKKIKLENMHKVYKLRPELSKSNKFYDNYFNTNVNYELLMDFKKDLMQ